ncbi:MAG: ABC transporter ATP-binding protein [Kangiella sp.]|nr:MAG: ABC transporter ATP-binding protein [Kangiella sp.]
MAKITLKNIRHSYDGKKVQNKSWALEKIDLEWSDGGAYALLGPSGCGKSTLLNIISGVLKPTQGKIVFGEEDVTDLESENRNIAQVFQFPVVYDTMTVYQNLAFPLKNKGLNAEVIDKRVLEIADMLDLTDSLNNKASGLSADGKQKISLGRGLVRDDVNVIMFDEPLTVIDPHLKWQLRSKLKELHQKLAITMIYVTHDQTEALTFADKVVVMKDGKILQVGSPVELFEKPQHTFVGHFIGSPGMNLIPCDIQNEKDEFTVFIDALFDKQFKALLKKEPAQLNQNQLSQNGSNKTQVEIGIRPEFVTFSEDGLPVTITKVSDVGRYKIVETIFVSLQGEHLIKLIVKNENEIPKANAKITFNAKQTHCYINSWLVQ